MTEPVKPFYHRATILFTALRRFDRVELEAILDRRVVHPDIVKYSLEVEKVEEPFVGQPEDL